MFLADWVWSSNVDDAVDVWLALMRRQRLLRWRRTVQSRRDIAQTPASCIYHPPVVIHFALNSPATWRHHTPWWRHSWRRHHTDLRHHYTLLLLLLLLLLEVNRLLTDLLDLLVHTSSVTPINVCHPKKEGKVMSICKAPIHETAVRRSGIARIVKGYHSFTCTPRRLSAIRMSHTCLCLPSRSWYLFTDPGGMEGWVDLGAK